MNQTLDVSLVIQSPSKNTQRNSCSTAVSEDSIGNQDRNYNLQFEFQNSNNQRILQFQSDIFQPQLTPKLNKRAIHVLFSICWDRDIKLQSVWSALMLYYSYKAKRIIRKIDLQKIVSVCILLGCKLFEPGKISLKDIIQITNGKYSTTQVSQTETQILEALDFNLYIENAIYQAISFYSLEEIQLNEFYCLAQLMMIKNSDIFWKKPVLSGLIKLIRSVSFENQNGIKAELDELSRSKEGQFLLRKYASKIDTSKLLQKLRKF